MAEMVIYTLRLRDGHYYVGKTGDAARRQAQHAGAKPARWVELHGPPQEPLFVVRVRRAAQRQRRSDSRGMACARRADSPACAQEVSRHDSSGAENQVTASLMWALGVGRVRGGQMHHARPYTQADLEPLTCFLGQILDLDFALVRRRLAAQLPPAGAARAAGVCADCGRAVASRSHERCARCYFAVVVCYACGVTGHLGRQCPLNAAAAAAPGDAATSSQEPPSSQPPAPWDTDADDELPLNMLELWEDAIAAMSQPVHVLLPGRSAAAGAEAEADAAAPSSSQPDNQASASAAVAWAAACWDCPSPAPRGCARCWDCFLKVSSCSFCLEKGHLERDCPRAQYLKDVETETETSGGGGGGGGGGGSQLSQPSQQQQRLASPPAAAAAGAAQSPAAAAGGPFREGAPRFTKQGTCFTCGRDAWPYGHYAQDCDADTDIRGSPIPNKRLRPRACPTS
jgi:hypothetical protein